MKTDETQWATTLTQIVYSELPTGDVVGQE